MSISCIKRFLVIFFMFGNALGIAQSDFEGLNETSFAVNYKASETYRFNVSVQSRGYLLQDEKFNYEQRQFDITHFSTAYLNYNKSISIGIRYRNRELFDDSSNELRITEQYNYTKSTEPLRFGHRIRLEQRILSNYTIHRWRYRFAVDLPLNGLKLDIGESYLITAMEALFSTSNATKPEWDHRTTAQIGWLISKSFKLQMGLEYRFEAVNITTEHKLFSLISGILTL